MKSKAFLLIICAIFLLILNFAIRYFLKRSSYFKIEKITMDAGPIDIPEFREKSLFGIDIKKISSNVKARNPEIKDLIVLRRLPNELVFKFGLREPIAQIECGRFYPVDEEGVILPGVKNFPLKELPIISGLAREVVVRNVGKKSKLKNLKSALKMIEELSEIVKVHRVDVSSSLVTLIFIEKGIQLKLPNKNFKDKIITLKKLIRQLNGGLSEVKYIDLRFKDPIVTKRR